MTESFTIPYPKTPSGKKQWSKDYGLNAYYAGKHWSKRKQDAEFWHMITRSAMNYCNVRRKPFEKPVIITFYWNDRLDCDNHGIMGKFIVDSMQGRVIVNDNRRWVKGIEHYFSNEDCIRVEVREVSNG